MKEFESFAILHGLDEDVYRTLAACHLHLQGPALTWYNGRGSYLDWNTVKERFAEKYITVS